MSPRPFLRLTLATLLALVAGCGHAQRPMTVSVRDLVSREPVAGATVRVRPLWFFAPVPSLGDPTLNPSAHGGGETGTDDQGRASIAAPLDQPYEVFVFVPFAAVQGRTFDAHPADLEDGDTGWLRLIGADDAEGPVFEIRLTAPPPVS